MWKVCMGDTSRFSDGPVWAADWDGDDDLNTTLLPDGWTYRQLVGKQFAGTTLVDAGFDCDLNVFDLSYFGYGEDDELERCRARVAQLEDELQQCQVQCAEWYRRLVTAESKLITAQAVVEEDLLPLLKSWG